MSEAQKGYVFLTLLSEKSVDRVVSGLVGCGFSVQTIGAKSGVETGSMVSVLSLLVALEEEKAQKCWTEHGYTGIYEWRTLVCRQVSDILQKKEVVTLSVVVIPGQPGASWAADNVQKIEKVTTSLGPYRSPGKMTN